MATKTMSRAQLQKRLERLNGRIETTTANLNAFKEQRAVLKGQLAEMKSTTGHKLKEKNKSSNGRPPAA